MREDSYAGEHLRSPGSWVLVVPDVLTPPPGAASPQSGLGQRPPPLRPG